MRITLNHLSLCFPTNLIPAELTPCNKELLIGSKTVERRRGMLLFRFLICQKCDLRSGKVADALAQHQVPVVVNPRFDEVIIELVRDAHGTSLETFLVIYRPPVLQPAISVEFRSLIVKAVADLVPDYNSNGTVIHGIDRVHIESRRLKNRGGKDNLVEQRIV